MTMRTTTKTVIFRRPFALGGFDEVQPAGTYCVETDEELVQGISFPVYRRTLTLIHLHARPEEPGVVRTWTIDPKELEVALERDRAPAAMRVGRDAGEKAPRRTTKVRQMEADRQAMDRAEDEGMIVHPR